MIFRCHVSLLVGKAFLFAHIMSPKGGKTHGPRWGVMSIVIYSGWLRRNIARPLHDAKQPCKLQNIQQAIGTSREARRIVPEIHHRGCGETAWEEVNPN